MDSNTVEFQKTIEQLSPNTQAYLLNLVNMARIAEQSIKNEISKRRTKHPE